MYTITELYTCDMLVPLGSRATGGTLLPSTPANCQASLVREVVDGCKTKGVG